jgi:hypothetical protein
MGIRDYVAAVTEKGEGRLLGSNYSVIEKGKR